jgi:hypothetical protein
MIVYTTTVVFLSGKNRFRLFVNSISTCMFISAHGPVRLRTALRLHLRALTSEKLPNDRGEAILSVLESA